MKEYGKTENLFARDSETHKLVPEFKIPEVGLIRNDRWIVTEKIDGTNIRVIIHADGIVEVRGRSDNANLPTGLVASIFQSIGADPITLQLLPSTLYALREVCGVRKDPERPIGFCFYGEGHGAGIQKNGGRYSAEKRLAVFDLATFIDDSEQVEPTYQMAYRDWPTMNAASSVLGLDVVPVLFPAASIATIIELVHDGFMTQMPDSKPVSTARGGEWDAEGIVARTDPYLYYGRNKSRLMFKCKTEDLRKSEESLGLDSAGITDWLDIAQVPA